jgi:hypothetical protein
MEAGYEDTYSFLRLAIFRIERVASATESYLDPVKAGTRRAHLRDGI